MKKATFWISKNGDGYFPISPEFVNYDSKSGCVNDVTEALGEKYTDEQLLLSSYTNIDKILENDGIKCRFTTNLLKFFEPKIVELTDEQYSRWLKNISE